MVIDWNLHRSYDQKTSNCQQFVDDLCKALDINLQLQGTVGDYLSSLRESGKCDISYSIDDGIVVYLYHFTIIEMRVKFNIKDKVKKFASHKELDDFVRFLTEQDPSFPQTHAMELGLLKSFDRAFWLRHYKHPEDETYKPHECFFNDPNSTASIKSEWF